MNKEKWEQAAEELKPLLKQLSDIAKRYEFDQNIYSIGINGNGYVSSCLIDSDVHYVTRKLSGTENFIVEITSYLKQENKL